MHPRKKIHQLSNLPQPTLISYEKDYTDIFRLAKPITASLEYECLSVLPLQLETRYKIIVCDRHDYYPLIYSNHYHSDIEHASQIIMDLHKRYLGISNSSLRIEIDPHVSLEG